MTENTAKLEIRLRAKGGSGPNTNWLWEIHDATGTVLKNGTISGPEHKAFSTARQARDKMVKADAKPK